MDQSMNGQSISWLRITEYLQGWLRTTFGGGKLVKGQKVLSVYDVEGIGEAMMMPVDDHMPHHGTPGNSISATWYNALYAGVAVDPGAIKAEYGVDRETLRQYMPIACPRKAVSEDGIVRPWTGDTCFGMQQAKVVQRLLREAFWRAVLEFSKEYAREHTGEQYAQVEMIEAFCRATGTDEINVEAIRREWQRRQKRMKL